MAVIIDRKNNDLLITFSYSPERISKIKSIKGYRWDAHQKSWFVPYTETNLSILKSLFHNEQMIVKFDDNSSDAALINLMEQELKLKGYSFKT